jgi:hypothetical protein
MICAYGASVGIVDCDHCIPIFRKDCTIRKRVESGALDFAFTENDRVLGKAKLSPNYQFSLIAEVRPWVPVKPGQSIQYRRLRNGMVIIELVVDDKEGGE